MKKQPPMTNAPATGQDEEFDENVKIYSAVAALGLLFQGEPGIKIANCADLATQAVFIGRAMADALKAPR